VNIRLIRVDDWNLHEHHLDIQYTADEFRFSTKIFYHDISFSTLISKYSKPIIHQIAAHVAFFEGMKICSLFPQYYDISILAENLSSSALDIFYQVYSGVFAQHWYENQIIDYPGPQIIFPGQILGKSQLAEVLEANPRVLIGCGGGKDSVLAMKVLQEAKIPFASMQYAHSVYGKAENQHDLIAEVLEYVEPVRKHQISIYDDFARYPLMPLYFPGNSGITVPETPVSVFESLFLALYWGYSYLSLAHEKSANSGNLYWSETNCKINHQWGKSFDAEKLINQFIQENLISNFNYFSILQPIYDFRIFRNLTRYPEILYKIHSCNVQKPWCKKCAKCAYVWLGLMAVFPPEQVNSIFQVNLFDDPDLLHIFKQMLGLTEHTPFECIGEVDESRLNMKKCWDKGLSGQVLDLFKAEILENQSINWSEIEQKYDHIYEAEHSVPDWIFEQIKIYL